MAPVASRELTTKKKRQERGGESHQRMKKTMRHHDDDDQVCPCYMRRSMSSTTHSVFHVCLLYNGKICSVKIKSPPLIPINVQNDRVRLYLSHRSTGKHNRIFKPEFAWRRLLRNVGSVSRLNNWRRIFGGFRSIFN